MLSAAASSAGGDIGDDWGAAGAAPDTAPDENAWDADAGDAGGAGDKEFSIAGFDDFGTDWAAGDDGSATVSDPASADLGETESGGYDMGAFDIGGDAGNIDSFAAEATSDFGVSGGANDYGDFSAAADTQISDAGTGDIGSFGNESNAVTVAVSSRCRDYFASLLLDHMSHAIGCPVQHQCSAR